MYYVTGGEYTSTKFDKLQDGVDLEIFGPYNNYDDALKKHQERAWQTVDNCLARYTITESTKL